GFFQFFLVLNELSEPLLFPVLIAKTFTNFKNHPMTVKISSSGFFQFFLVLNELSEPLGFKRISF
uniref:hypothetical protein n=1 Tax=Brochothrix thermosphacta TaxID=2756 RepID=UPI001C63942F